MTDYTDSIQQFAACASWLDKFNWRKYKIKQLWSKMPFVGVYLPLLKTIYVAPDVDPTFEFATIIHELRHAYQKHTMGMLKYLWKKAFHRKDIEKDAEDAECVAVEWYMAKLDKESI